MLYYKIDVLRALKDAGYNTARIKREKLFAATTVVNLTHGEMIGSLDTLGRICALLNCQPGDLIGYKPDEKS